jgi:UDP-N-acetylglucosamine diphosphorylase/glucosamine-1-phosphate N-acetyltransferase
MFTLRERIVHLLRPRVVSLCARTLLARVLKDENPRCEINRVSSESCLLVNGGTLMSDTLARTLRKHKSDAVFVSGNDIVAILLSGNNLRSMRPTLENGSFEPTALAALERIECDAATVNYPWDLIYANDSALHRDFRLLCEDGGGLVRTSEIHKSAVLIRRKNIHIGGKSVVSPGVVLDATEGPIVIGERVRIYPHAVIEGPCFVGDGSTIKISGKIYGKTTIGPGCKIGGEVEHSIFHSHVNKQHDGFVGHSYVCPWVNLGAGTTTSNLKNTYGTVRVIINGKHIDSGRMFVGLTAGDHVKVGINGTLDTGTVIGPSSNVFGTAIPPKSIPAFAWGSGASFVTYDVGRGISVAETVMKRRGVQATDSYKELFRNVFELTRNEREGFGS